MFHNVTDNYVDTIESCKCKITEFKNILNLYEKRGYKFVSVEEALSIIRNRDRTKFVVVTFDDIPDNVYTNAYPILKARKIPFTVFIAVNLIDTDGFVSMEHLKEMSRDYLCTVGAHTMSHPFLRKSKEIEWEIRNSRIILESLLNVDVKYFAYPFGRSSSVSKKVIKCVRKAEFECAFSSISAPLSDSSLNTPYFLPRIVPDFSKEYTNKFSFDALRTIMFYCVRPIKVLLNYRK